MSDRWNLRRTQYVLTNRRAFAIIALRGGRNIRFIFLDALPAEFNRSVQCDGSGDLAIGRGMGFKQIANASEVHRPLVAAVLSARRDLPDLGWQEPAAVAAVVT